MSNTEQEVTEHTEQQKGNASSKVAQENEKIQ